MSLGNTEESEKYTKGFSLTSAQANGVHQDLLNEKHN